MDDLTYRAIAGQALSLVALALCVIAFSSRNDQRLMLYFALANSVFALHFALLGSWTAAALTVLVVVRATLARRFKGSWMAAILVLAASGVAAALTWQGPLDILPLTAAALGTVGMFLLQGVPMRIALTGTALAWMLNNIAVGSIGGVVAEALILATNIATIMRMTRDRPCYSALQESQHDMEIRSHGLQPKRQD